MQSLLLLMIIFWILKSRIRTDSRCFRGWLIYIYLLFIFTSFVLFIVWLENRLSSSLYTLYCIYNTHHTIHTTRHLCYGSKLQNQIPLNSFPAYSIKCVRGRLLLKLPFYYYYHDANECCKIRTHRRTDAHTFKTFEAVTLKMWKFNCARILLLHLNYSLLKCSTRMKCSRSIFSVHRCTFRFDVYFESFGRRRMNLSPNNSSAINKLTIFIVLVLSCFFELWSDIKWAAHVENILPTQKIIS